MSARHIYRFDDGARAVAQKFPLCGQANAHGGTVIGPEEPTPEDATCKRCIKRHEAGEL
ncbi:hypothetical protein [Curtobacterium sp. UCD-KPL2560]|uniref:hypothetical protein n=1 Tax=Curtobacterium sp. UCD-KPL2560 TaxID=1885315 RepID=UPI001495849F|nr:hypothetical protein [Curtobacterium sp. UCD-KPL2560]